MTGTATIEVRIADTEPVLRLLADLRDTIDELRRRENAAVRRFDRSEGRDDFAAAEGQAYESARRMLDDALARMTAGESSVSWQEPDAEEPF